MTLDKSLTLFIDVWLWLSIVLLGAVVIYFLADITTPFKDTPGFEGIVAILVILWVMEAAILSPALAAMGWRKWLRRKRLGSN